MSKFASYVFGLGISFMLGCLIAISIKLLPQFLLGIDVPVGLITFVMIQLGLLVCFYVPGFEKVPVASFAVLTLFGTRRTETLPGTKEAWLTEGIWWLPPIPFVIEIERIFSQQEFNIERVVEGFVRSGSATNESDSSTLNDGLVKITVETNTTVQIENPLEYLSREDSIEQSLGEIIQMETREKLSAKDLMAVLSSEKVDDNIMAQIREAIALKADADNWGLKIIRVAIPKITPDQAIVKALEDKTRELLETGSESVEVDHLVASALKIKDGLGVSGIEAIRAFNIAQGKLKPEELGIRGQAGGRGRGGRNMPPVIITDDLNN